MFCFHGPIDHWHHAMNFYHTWAPAPLRWLSGWNPLEALLCECEVTARPRHDHTLKAPWGIWKQSRGFLDRQHALVCPYSVSWPQRTLRIPCAAHSHVSPLGNSACQLKRHILPDICGSAGMHGRQAQTQRRLRQACQRCPQPPHSSQRRSGGSCRCGYLIFLYAYMEDLGACFACMR